MAEISSGPDKSIYSVMLILGSSLIYFCSLEQQCFLLPVLFNCFLTAILLSDPCCTQDHSLLVYHRAACMHNMSPADPLPADAAGSD